jgi:hypothetical protein
LFVLDNFNIFLNRCDDLFHLFLRHKDHRKLSGFHLQSSAHVCK